MPTPEELAAQQAAEAEKKFAGLDPETQKFVKDLREEAKGYRIKLQSLETMQKEFDDLKKKQSDAEAAALAQKGEFEKLANQRKEELDKLKPDYDRLKAFEAGMRKGLLEKLPEDAREKYKDIQTDVLEDLVTRLTGEEFKPNKPDKPGTNGTTSLEQQLVEAQKKGDTAVIVALKRQIAEKAKAA